MQVIQNPLTVKELQKIADHTYGNLVKGVIDVGKKIVAIDAEMHADLEQFLLASGSTQRDLWGINLHPDNYSTDHFIEYDSMINLRPNQNNFSRSVDDPQIRLQIMQIVKNIIK